MEFGLDQTCRRPVADLHRAGIWPITHYLSSELARASRSATSLGPVCDHSVMEFGLYLHYTENKSR